jgi:long-chain acyl-CoA synthetase
MYYSMTTIGFFDSMGPESVDFILNQTELSCIFTTPEYIKKIVSMKKEGLAKNVKFLVSFDEPTPEQLTWASSVAVKVYTFKDVIK